jgi:heptosyltransferase-2
VSTLVIRFSSLGDIVLTGAVTGALAPVTFLTLRRYVDVAAALPGVERVHAWEDGRPNGRFDRIVDLHASPRSRWTGFRVPGTVSRVRRYDLRRRSRVTFKTAPPPSVIDRYAAAAGVAPAALPWLSVDGPRDALMICPGSAHATKRWGPSGFAAVANRWCAAGRPVVLLGSASEAERLADVARGIDGAATVVAEDGFQQTLAALGRGRVALGGDTGLSHLCVAAGIPTAVVFGPTTASDGYWGHGGHAIEADLPCRPCSRHGTDRCAFGDHHCMKAIDVDSTWEAVSGLGSPGHIGGHA